VAGIHVYPRYALLASMSPRPPTFEPMRREDVLSVLERPSAAYDGAPYLRITRIDGSVVVGERNRYRCALPSVEEGDSDGADSEGYVALCNVDFDPASEKLVSVGEVADIFDFGVRVRAPSPREFVEWAGTKVLGVVLKVLPFDLLATEEAGDFRFGKPVFDRDIDIYRDLDFFRDHAGGMNQLGISVLVAGLNLGWASSLAKAAHDRVERTPNPYFGVCQEPEVVLRGFLTIFLDPDTGEARRAMMGNRKWLEGMVHENQGGGAGRGSWVPVLLREDLITDFTLESFLKIDQPVHVYGQTYRFDELLTPAGAAPCHIMVRLAAYLDPQAERPGWLRRNVRRVIR
jgi:hypothetical protein